MKAETAIPYLYEYYNIVPLYAAIASTTKSVIVRTFNEFVVELNKKNKLPRYVVILLDKDVIEAVNFDEFGMGQILFEQVDWLAKNMETVLDLRKEDIKYKNPGALWSNAEPRIIWVKMLTRPIIRDAYKPFVFAQCAKFNESIDEIASTYKHSHVLTVNLSDEKSLFDRSGNLSPNGKIILWREINITMRAFDRDQIDLKPKQPKQKDDKERRNPRGGQGDGQDSTRHNSSQNYPSKDRGGHASGSKGKNSLHNNRYSYHKGGH